MKADEARVCACTGHCEIDVKHTSVVAVVHYYVNRVAAAPRFFKESKACLVTIKITIRRHKGAASARRNMSQLYAHLLSTMQYTNAICKLSREP